MKETRIFKKEIRPATSHSQLQCLMKLCKIRHKSSGCSDQCHENTGKVPISTLTLTDAILDFQRDYNGNPKWMVKCQVCTTILMIRILLVKTHIFHFPETFSLQWK